MSEHNTDMQIDDSNQPSMSNIQFEQDVAELWNFRVQR